MFSKIEEIKMKIKSKDNIIAIKFKEINNFFSNLTWFTSIMLYEAPISFLMLITSYILNIDMNEYWLKILAWNIIWWLLFGGLNMYVDKKIEQDKALLFPTCFIFISDIMLLIMYIILKKLGLYGIQIQL